MSMPERDTMRLRNKQVLGTICFMLLSASSFWGTQGAATPPQQNAQSVQATPIPADIDPTDPALPAWAKPATPAPGAAKTTKPNAPANIPGLQPDGGTAVGVASAQAAPLAEVQSAPLSAWSAIMRV